MNYTLHQLQVFLKITETQSITKAAEELHLTQPAVSIQLRNLQEQFEIPLTEVIGRKLFITEFGKEIAQAAAKIHQEVLDINSRTLAYKGKLAGRLRLSSVSTGKYVLPYFLTDFIHENEGVELALDVTNKQAVIKTLQKNEVDFSLVSLLPETLKVESISLMENELFLVGSKDMAVPIKDGGKTLPDVPFIYREKGSGTRFVMERFIKNNNLSIKKKMELTSNEAVKQAVVAGLGCSIMPLIGMKNELEQGALRIIPVQGLPITSTWKLVWLKDKKLTPVAQAYLNYLQKDKEEIIKTWFGNL